LVLFSLFVAIQSHGRLTAPLSRGKRAGKADYQEDAPVTSANGADFVCRNDPEVNPSLYVPLTAGGSYSVSWNLPAAHVGDCFVYFTYDATLPDAQKLWFKVAEWAKCETKMNVLNSFAIPSYLPSSPHIIVRWEWYALHVRSGGTIEFYCQCFDASITGATPGQLPDPKVNIPGHLPTTASLYRDGYATPFWFIGPQVATIGGAPYTTGQYAYTGTGSGPVPPPSPPAGTGGTPPPPPELTTEAVIIEVAANDEQIYGDRIPCVKNEDCPNGICLLDRYCLAKGQGVESLGKGGIAALVFAGLIIITVLAAAGFFFLNRKEVPYMIPFKGRL